MTHRLLILVLLSLTLCTTSLAQKSKFEGYLYNDQEEPEAAVKVKILPAKRTATTAGDGHFQIFFETLGPGEGVNLVIDRANWLVYEPLYGKATTKALNSRWTEKVYIAEKSSRILYGSRALLALIRQFETDRAAAATDILRLENENRKLQGQNVALNKELTAALERERENSDLNVYLDRYAAFYGINKEQVLSAVIAWARPSPDDTEEQKAVKLLFNRDYPGAGDVASADAEKKMEALVITDKNIAKLKKSQEVLTGGLIRTMHIAILARYRERRFREALEKYDRLQKFLVNKKVPIENYPRELASARLLAANSKAYLARTVTRRGPEARQLLTEAIEQFRELLSFHDPKQNPQLWAGIQINLGNAIQELVFKVGVPDSAERLAEAETAYREAIKIWRLEPTIQFSDPSCLCGELHLAAALFGVGVLGGPDSTQFLEEAEKAYRKGIASLDRNVQPQEWLLANLNLGRVLQELGRRDGSETAGYHKKAETVLRGLLTSTKDEKSPCACVEEVLANVLHDQGMDRRGPESIQFLKDAHAHYEVALKLTPKQDMPEAWAQTMMNIASVQQRLGERIRQEAPTLFKQAEEAWREVLALGENEIFPKDRVRAQAGLADSLRYQATLLPLPEPYLKRAEMEGRKAVALSKDPSVVKPCDCTIGALAGTLVELGRLGGPKSIDYFKEAEQLFREALEVDSQIDWEIKANLASVQLFIGLGVDPIDQAYVKQSVDGFREYFKNSKTPKSRPSLPSHQANFGRGLHVLSDLEDPPNLNLHRESEAAFLNAIQGFTFEEETQSWIMARIDLGSVLMHLAQLDDGERVVHIKKAESYYREIFTHDIRREYPADWIAGQLELGMALVELAHTNGENHREKLKEAETFLREALKFNLQQPDQVNVMPIKFRLAGVLEDLGNDEEEIDRVRIAYLEEAKKLHLDLVRTPNPETVLVDWSESMRILADICRTLARLSPNPLSQLKEAEVFIQETTRYPLLQRNEEQWLRVQVTFGDLLHDFASVDTRRFRRHLRNVRRCMKMHW